MHIRPLGFVYLISWLVVLVGCKSPQEPAQQIEARILRYGIWDSSTQNRAGAGGRPILAAETDQIPAKRGVRFGFEFEVTGLSMKGEELRLVVNHPPLHHPDGSVTTSDNYQSWAAVPVNGRVVEASAFGFDQDYEVVAGKWTLQIWRGRQKLIEKTFEAFHA